MPGKLNASVLDVGNKQERCKNSVCPTRSQRKANWEVAKGQGVVEVKHSRPECITGPEHSAQLSPESGAHPRWGSSSRGAGGFWLAEPQRCPSWVLALCSGRGQVQRSPFLSHML